MNRIPFCTARLLLALLCISPAHSLPAKSTASRDTFSDTWVATDALGRDLPLHQRAGSPRAGKFVGIFYFLWLGQHGEEGPFDISRILATEPAAITNAQSPLWGPLYAPHHWGEPVFGYYVSDDESVLEKHAQMLSDAGIDVVIFDVTNQLTYPRSWRALCRAWERVRRRGGRTPQIAFLCPFWDPSKVVRELFNDLYSQDLYSELWFRWEGKPLILADLALIGESLALSQHDTPAQLLPTHTLGQSFTATTAFDSVEISVPTWRQAGAAARVTLFREGAMGERMASERFTNIVDNAWVRLKLNERLGPGVYYIEMSEPTSQVGWWTASKNLLGKGEAFVDGRAVAGDRNIRVNYVGDTADRIRGFFTFRKPQPDYFSGPTGPNQWSWLEVHPQHGFTNSSGVVEETAVGVAQNAVDGRLSVLSNPRAHGRSFQNGRQPGPDGHDYTGRNFTEQWRRAFELDPSFVFVTGWNEWIAGRFDIKASFHQPGPVTFVDQFNQEYSRDCEPMKGGHGDVFYYQLVANVRRFKGVRPIEPVHPQPISLDGKFEDWANVTPEFRDDEGDPVKRRHRGWGKKTEYINETGRNDIIATKVSADGTNVYFYARVAGPLSPNADANWMMLFVDCDGNATNGWLGYDLVVNRKAAQEDTAMLERHDREGYSWSDVGRVERRVGTSEIEIAIPFSSLGIAKLPAAIDFKWADNIHQTGDWSDFTLNGDSAPNNRFNYRALLNSATQLPPMR